jgi:cytochrome P450
VVLPLSKPIIDSAGKEVTEILVESGTNIVMAVFAVNRNPEIWGPDADAWKPERWLSPLPKSVDEAHTPGVYSHLYVYASDFRMDP